MSTLRVTTVLGLLAVLLGVANIVHDKLTRPPARSALGLGTFGATTFSVGGGAGSPTSGPTGTDRGLVIIQYGGITDVDASASPASSDAEPTVSR